MAEAITVIKGRCLFMRILFFILIIITFNYSIAFAQEKTVTRSYTYDASQKDSYESSKDAALDQLKLELLMEACSFIFSKYESSEKYNGQEYKQSINIKLISVTTGYMKVKLLDEKWDGKRFWIKARITYDEDEIRATVEKAIKDIDFKDSIKEISVKELQNIIEQQNKEMESIRQKAITSERKMQLMKIISDQKVQIKKIKKIGGTRRNYSGQTAFLNIASTPSNVDTYLDGKWIGTTPIEKYEIEPNHHTITLRGNPQYYVPKKDSISPDVHEQVFKRYDLQKGNGKVLLISKYPIERIILNGKEVFFEESSAIVTMPAGDNTLEVFDEKGYVKDEIDVWHDEFLRKDINENDYTSGASRKLTDGYRSVAKSVKGIDVGFQYLGYSGGSLSGPFVTFREFKLGYWKGEYGPVQELSVATGGYIERYNPYKGLSFGVSDKDAYLEMSILDNGIGLGVGGNYRKKNVGFLLGLNWICFTDISPGENKNLLGVQSGLFITF